jgi:hypothetical protein
VRWAGCSLVLILLLLLLLILFLILILILILLLVLIEDYRTPRKKLARQETGGQQARKRLSRRMDAAGRVVCFIYAVPGPGYAMA